MNELSLWLLISIALLLLLILCSAGVLIWVLLKHVRKLAETQTPVQIRMLDLVDKMTTIAAAQDVAAYQGIQVMQSQVAEYAEFDPSDEGEAKREQALYRREMTDGLDDNDLSALYG